jgi:hypothetical protein
MRRSSRRWLVRLAATTAVATATSLAVALPAHAAITIRSVEVALTTVGSFATRSVLVSCNANEKVISGGFLTQSMSPLVKYTASFPVDDVTWQVTALNRSTISQQITVRAYCATGVAGYSQRLGPTGHVNGGTFGNAEASCPDGKIALGGGFRFAQDHRLIVNASRMSASNTWQTRVFNGADNAVVPQAAVTCTTQTGQFAAATVVAANAGQSGFFSNRCNNAVTTGGGFRLIGSEPNTTIVTATIPTSPGWKLNYNNQTAANRSIEHSLVCFPS